MSSMSGTYHSPRIRGARVSRTYHSSVSRGVPSAYWVETTTRVTATGSSPSYLAET